MKRFVQSFTWVLLALFALLYSVRSTDAQAQAGYAVRTPFAFRSASITLHEPVYVDVVIQNGLLEPIQFDLGANSQAKFGFSIQDPTGGRHHAGTLREPPFHGLGHVELLPGKSYEGVLLLNVWYQFTIPGKYHVRPYLATPITAATQVITPTSNSPEFELEVLPRNAKHLRGVCASLAAVATANSGGKSFDAAAALSYVLDIDAVPYLVRVAQIGDTTISSVAVDGLARISRVAGLESVFREAGPTNTQLQSAVKQAVYNMEHGVTALD